jgi:hypothetical protein
MKAVVATWQRADALSKFHGAQADDTILTTHGALAAWQCINLRRAETSAQVFLQNWLWYSPALHKIIVSDCHHSSTATRNTLRDNPSLARDDRAEKGLETQ